MPAEVGASANAAAVTHGGSMEAAAGTEVDTTVASEAGTAVAMGVDCINILIGSWRPPALLPNASESVNVMLTIAPAAAFLFRFLLLTLGGG